MGSTASSTDEAVVSCDRKGDTMAQKKKAVVLFSGGVDSTTCLALAIERFGKDNVVPLSIQYGQKHSKELEAAIAILEYYNMKGKNDGCY